MTPLPYQQIPRTCVPHSKIEEDIYDWWERHAQKQREAAAQQYDIVFLGDSITHFWHDEMDKFPACDQVWQEFYGKRKVLNLGFGFDRPQNVLYRLENGEFPQQSPKVIVLNLGTNCLTATPRYSGDTPEIAFAGILCVIQKLFQLAPNAHLVLMGLFPRLPSERQAQVDSINTMLAQFSSMHEKEITFLDLKEKLTKDGVLNPELYRDGVCHPNATGYRIWAEALEGIFKKFNL